MVSSTSKLMSVPRNEAPGEGACSGHAACHSSCLRVPDLKGMSSPQNSYLENRGPQWWPSPTTRYLFALLCCGKRSRYVVCCLAKKDLWKGGCKGISSSRCECWKTNEGVWQCKNKIHFGRQYFQQQGSDLRSETVFRSEELKPGKSSSNKKRNETDRILPGTYIQEPQEWHLTETSKMWNSPGDKKSYIQYTELLSGEREYYVSQQNSFQGRKKNISWRRSRILHEK